MKKNLACPPLPFACKLVEKEEKMKLYSDKQRVNLLIMEKCIIVQEISTIWFRFLEKIFETAILSFDKKDGFLEEK